LQLRGSFAIFAVKIFFLRTQLKLTIAWIGKTKNPAIQSLTDEYLKRLRQVRRSRRHRTERRSFALLKLCQARAQDAGWCCWIRAETALIEELAAFLREHQERDPRRWCLPSGLRRLQ